MYKDCSVILASLYVIQLEVIGTSAISLRRLVTEPKGTSQFSNLSAKHEGY